jgi:hypothetical protein
LDESHGAELSISAELVGIAQSLLAHALNAHAPAQAGTAG